jgi:hypothetical protein
MTCKYCRLAAVGAAAEYATSIRAAVAEDERRVAKRAFRASIHRDDERVFHLHCAA